MAIIQAVPARCSGLLGARDACLSPGNICVKAMVSIPSWKGLLFEASAGIQAGMALCWDIAPGHHAGLIPSREGIQGADEGVQADDPMHSVPCVPEYSQNSHGPAAGLFCRLLASPVGLTGSLERREQTLGSTGMHWFMAG